MTKVGKSDGEGTFPRTRGNDKVAPIPAVRRVSRQGVRTTHKSHSWPCQRIVGSIKKRPFARDFCTKAHPSPTSYSANGREERGLETTGPHRITGGHGGSGWRLERDQSFGPPCGVSYRGMKLPRISAVLGRS
jgi:hypothetical protein